MRGYEGGQTGLLKAIPKLGARNGRRETLARLRLDTIQHWIDRKRLDPSQPITIKHLVESRCIGSLKDGIVLLAHGGQYFKDAINIEVTHATQNAINLIEARGGKVTCFDFDRQSMAALIKSDKFLGPPTASVPTEERIDARYFDEARRGYLSDKANELMKLAKPVKKQ
ncbi:YmL10 [Blyttiomyces sp. JEL0837]|nr:YmL10 [Blyttiomyces sp. JEL0837]